MPTTTPTPRAGQPPRPIAVHFHFDKIQVWRKTPVSKRELGEIRQHCGPSGAHVENDSGKIPGRIRYRQRLDLFQPDRVALEMIAAFDEPLLNHVEFGVDLVFPDEREADACVIYIGERVVQSWHRASMPCGIFENHDLPDKPMRRAGPGYSTRLFEKNKPHVGRFITVYAAYCRVTGEVGCCHLESRFAGVKALRRIGIHHPRDLRDFDFPSHFAKYITLYEMNYERLGRYDRNRRSGAKIKKSPIVQYGSFAYNSDYNLGCALFRSYAQHEGGYHHSLQRFVDVYKRGPYLRKLPTLFFICMDKSNTSSQTPIFKASTSLSHPQKPPKSRQQTRMTASTASKRLENFNDCKSKGR